MQQSPPHLGVDFDEMPAAERPVRRLVAELTGDDLRFGGVTARDAQTETDTSGVTEISTCIAVTAAVITELACIAK